MENGVQLYGIINDKLMPMQEASLHVSDLSVQRGYGIFDFFKVSDGHPFFLSDYLDRFYRSSEIMRLMVPYQREKIKSLIYRLIEKNHLPQSGVKMILTGGYSLDGFLPGLPNLIITQQRLSLPGRDQIEKGVPIITYEYVRDLPAAKTINYAMGIWLLDRVAQASAYDVLYVKDGIVSEFPRCNVFVVTREGKVLTPSDNVLHGVTRKNVLRLAARRFDAAEDNVTLDALYQAREVFLTSTTKRIVPVVTVDGRAIGNGQPGPVTRQLLEDLMACEEEDRRLHV
jgi:branched-subunit amino acid aminotransferase/4-amino-4-deoxychorismate lyase